MAALAALLLLAGTGLEGGICGLVTDSEIVNIMGRPPTIRTGAEVYGDRYCTWTFSMKPLEAVRLALAPAGQYEVDRTTENVPVAGLGEDAYWVTFPNREGLHVKTGAYRLFVGVDSESRDIKAAATSVARVALDRLP